MTDLNPQITLHSASLPSPLPSSPSFIFHLTHLRDTLLIWVGTGQPTDPGQSTDELAVIPSEKSLGRDWAVAMPARGSIPVTSTSLYRGGGDLALAMSQRLARKFPSNQIQLSLSLPMSLTSSSGPSLDPFASKTLLVMEKKLGGWLEGVLEAEA